MLYVIYQGDWQLVVEYRMPHILCLYVHFLEIYKMYNLKKKIELIIQPPTIYCYKGYQMFQNDFVTYMI